MRRRLLLPSVTLWLLVAPILRAQLSSDPTKNRLAVIDHLAAVTQSDLKNLLSQAESGDPEAQYWLGLMYGEGRLVPKDWKQAESWILQSAEKGYAPAQRTVGMMFWKRDPVKCERWLLRAAEQGDSEAQFWLGVAYEQNWFGTTDLQEAAKWYQKAAEQGHPDAQNSLGQMYEQGDGLKQDYVLAAEWYRKAADHVPSLGGAGQGRNNLGLLYTQGLGVPKDYVQAYMWFNLADDDASRSDVQAEMTPAQILEAQRMTEEWKSHHPVP